MTSHPRTFTDHLTLWIRWRWLLIGSVFGAALLTAIISSFLPKTYRSSAVVLPPFEGRAALPFLEGISLDIFGVNEISTAGLVTLLKSRTLKDRVNQQIDLMEHYKKADIERAYAAFEDHLQVDIESEESFGAVTITAMQISVLDRDPEFAARMVNAVVGEWDKLCTEINRRGARLRREFVEENLWQVSSELAVSEDSLRAFQEEHGIASLGIQVQGTISAAMALEQEITQAKISVQVLEKLFGQGHPELKRAQLELRELQKAQEKYQMPSSEDQFLLPLNLAPEISLAYSRLLRRTRTLEAIHDVLVQNYEQARMQELKDTPALRIVDYGQVPLNKYRPKRIIMVVIAALSAFFMAMLLIYLLDYLNRVRGTEENQWIDEVTGHLRGDIRGILRFLKIDFKKPSQ